MRKPHHEMSGAVGGGSHKPCITTYPRIGQRLVVFAQDVTLEVAVRLHQLGMLANIGVAERVGHSLEFHHEVLGRNAVSLGKFPLLIFIVVEADAFDNLVTTVEINLLVTPDSPVSAEFVERVVENRAVPDDEFAHGAWWKNLGRRGDGQTVDDALELIANERVLAVRVATADGFAQRLSERHKHVLVAV